MVSKKSFARLTGASVAVGVGLAMMGAPAIAAKGYEYTAIPQDQMEATYVSSVEETGEGANGPIEKILDGDRNTYWHSKWNPSKDPLPHSFVVSLGEVEGELCRIDLLARQSSNSSGRVNEYQVWAVDTETCDETAFESAEPVATGNVPADSFKTEPLEITFDPLVANCVKVQYDSSWGGNNAPEQVGSLAEFNAYTAVEAEEEPDPEPGDGPQVVIPENAVGITDGTLTAVLHPDFPQVVGYVLNDKEIAGKFGDALDSIAINGEARPVTVGELQVAADQVTYPITFGDALEGVSFNVVVSVADSTLTYKITDIRDPNGLVNYIEIPNLDLVSVTDAQPGASVYGARVSVDRNVSGDNHVVLSQANIGNTPSVNSAWMITANTDEFAAGFDGNAVVDKTASKGGNADTKFKYRLERVDGVKVATVSPGEWVYRAGAVRAYDDGTGIGPDNDPYISVKFTEDANNDQKVDWQDGAIALRDIKPRSANSDGVENYVISRIPFNIVSQAAHPFLRTLDDTKRISLATDNLGQQVLLKGYQAEGHDSAQGDYAGHYNEKAGGLEDMKTLVSEGKNWNATFGIHVNATESYSEAYAFTDDLLQMPPRKAWGWMNQAYYMNNQKDLATGNVLKRLEELRADFPADSNMNWLYWDVYYPRGWEANRFSQEVSDQGWRIASEWSDAQIENNTWSHWANEEAYGGTSNKGLNSQLVRFVLNTDRDTFNPHPMLGNANVVEFEGWTGHNNYNAFIKNVWERNLPTKFLQQSEIMSWEPGQITFENGTVV